MTDVPTTELKLNDIAPDPTALTTGASPVTVALGPRLYHVTTGGTGVENIVLPAPTLSIGGSFNDQFIGLRITVTLVTQTDPGDAVRVTAEGHTFFPALAPSAISLGTLSAARLTYEGAAASFVWIGDQWTLDSEQTDVNYNADYNPLSILSFGGVTGSNGHGLDTWISAGDGSTGDGGNLRLSAGTPNGVVLVPNLPTADPLVANALWNNSGVLTISAG